MYEETVGEIVSFFGGGFLNEEEDLVSTLQAQLPNQAQVHSVINNWDEEGIYGTTSVVIVYSEDKDNILEEYLITWFEFWEQIMEHIQNICTGEVVSW